MSNQMPNEKDLQDAWEAESDNQPETEKKLELLDIKQDRSAKTFIYKDPNQTRKRESLWGRLWGEKSRSAE